MLAADTFAARISASRGVALSFRAFPQSPVTFFRRAIRATYPAGTIATKRTGADGRTADKCALVRIVLSLLQGASNIHWKINSHQLNKPTAKLNRYQTTPFQTPVNFDHRYTFQLGFNSSEGQTLEFNELSRSTHVFSPLPFSFPRY